MARSAGKQGMLTNLPAPYLKRVWLDPTRVGDPAAYPFCLPVFRDGAFSLVFDRAVTIVVGENAVGKSTILEGIAALSGFDEAGGGPGYRLVDHSGAVEIMGGSLAPALRASWLPRVTQGWFFRAESFSRSRAISTAPQRKTGPRRRTSCRCRTARAS